MREHRWFWEDEFGRVSPDWVILAIILAIVVLGLLGFWFNDMYTNRTGFFANL